MSAQTSKQEGNYVLRKPKPKPKPKLNLNTHKLIFRHETRFDLTLNMKNLTKQHNNPSYPCPYRC